MPRKRAHNSNSADSAQLKGFADAFRELLSSDFDNGRCPPAPAGKHMGGGIIVTDAEVREYRRQEQRELIEHGLDPTEYPDLSDDEVRNILADFKAIQQIEVAECLAAAGDADSTAWLEANKSFVSAYDAPDPDAEPLDDDPTSEHPIDPAEFAVWCLACQQIAARPDQRIEREVFGRWFNLCLAAIRNPAHEANTQQGFDRAAARERRAVAANEAIDDEKLAARLNRIMARQEDIDAVSAQIAKRLGGRLRRTGKGRST